MCPLQVLLLFMLPWTLWLLHVLFRSLVAHVTVVMVHVCCCILLVWLLHFAGVAAALLLMWLLHFLLLLFTVNVSLPWSVQLLIAAVVACARDVAIMCAVFSQRALLYILLPFVLVLLHSLLLLHVLFAYALLLRG